MTEIKTCAKRGEQAYRGGEFCIACDMAETMNDFYSNTGLGIAQMEIWKNEQLPTDQDREKAREAQRKYRKRFPERVRFRARRWAKSNREKRRANYHRRRSIKAGLPNDWTHEDEARALNYWNGCCAVCGRPLNDLFGDHSQSMDHWIAMTDQRPDNPGTVVANMLPMCIGTGACNNKKQAADPVEWLHREFGKRKAKTILKRIEDYFEWVKHDESRSA